MRLVGRPALDQARLLERLGGRHEPQVHRPVGPSPPQACETGSHGVAVDFRTDANLHLRSIERLKPADAAAPGDQARPEGLDVRADGAGDTEAGDGDPPSHTSTGRR